MTDQKTKLQIFHTVNCGLYLWDGNSGILVDGVHTAGAPAHFSPMPSEMMRWMETRTGLFAHLNGILFTHLHGDHYWETAVNHLTTREKSLPCWMPEMIHLSHAVDAGTNVRRIQMGTFRILCLETLHDGANYVEEPHNAFLVQSGTASVLIAGDSLFREQDLKLLTKFAPIQNAFFNLYQLSDYGNGPEIVRKLGIKRLFLYHLPFAQDDSENYRVLSFQILKRFPPELPRPVFAPHMSWIDDISPSWAAQQGE